MELSFGLRLFFASWGSPEVVVLVSPALFSTGLAILRARFSRKRPTVIVWVQDIYSRGIVETGGRSGITSKMMALLEGAVLASAHGVVAIHDRFARYLVSTLSVPAERVRTIRNWTHLRQSQVARREVVRNKLGWGESDIIALHCGNMGKKQGLENVVEAARFAEKTGSRVKFVLMGDGNQRPQLMQAAEGLTHLSFVSSLPQGDFQAALQSADVLLVNERPGVRDMSVPSKLTSYFTSGLPVVAATDVGSVTSEEIANSGGGIRVDPGDPASLVQAIDTLARDERLSAELAANGKRFQEETLSESAAIGHYDDFITSLALSRGR